MKIQNQEHKWLLENLTSELINNHPLPWHIDRDWTYEVLDANNGIVLKCQTMKQAETLIKLVDEITKAKETGLLIIEELLKP